MKINHILFEDHKSVDADWVKENCSEAIERYQKGYAIYRGDQSFVGYTLMTPRDVPRSAAYAGSNMHTEIINNSAEFDGFPNREIIMSTNRSRASGYGSTVYVCFPLNGANIGIVPDYDIYHGFSKINGALGGFYYTLREELLPFFAQWTRSDFTSVKNTHKVFADLHRNASEEDINDLIEAFEGIESNDYLYPYKENFIAAVRQGNGDPIISLFDSDGFKHVPISQFSTKGNHELWTDSPVVLVRMRESE